jgi:predicted RNase H-like nuclease
MPTCGRQREQAKLVTEPSATFVGIDLAWSYRNPSGGAVIRNGALLVSTGELGSDEEIVAFVRQWLPAGAPAIIGVDAPLRVPNLTGSRGCDRDLSAEWRRFEAGALPANRRLLETDGCVRGENLVSMLRTCCRIDERAVIPQRIQERIVCEVYPHPAHVSLFGLPKTLKYKARKGRSLADRRGELERYHDHLLGLAVGDPPLTGGLGDLLATDVHALRGVTLKAHEDRLDAVTCAYIACYL